MWQAQVVHASTFARWSHGVAAVPTTTSRARLFAAIGLGWCGAFGTKYVYQEIQFVVCARKLRCRARRCRRRALCAVSAGEHLLSFARIVADQQLQTDQVVAGIAELTEAMASRAAAAEHD